MTHAYLVAWYNNNNSFEDRMMTYPMLMGDYFDSDVNANEAQHNEMARMFVMRIGSALQEFGLANGYQLPSQFYYDLAWGGLTHHADNGLQTEWFKALVPDSNDRERIIDTIITELTGKDSNGNTRQQKGDDSDC
ncbi:MAG: hypothetical protein JXR07_06965 [Reichenbachiella sp.]